MPRVSGVQRLGAFALAALITLGSASAQTWTGPDASRRTYILGHAVENFAFALTEVCLPYMLQRAESNAWDRRTGVAPFPPGGPFTGLRTYLIGGGAGAIVGVGNRTGNRECTIKGDSVDNQIYLSAAEATLNPLGFVRLPAELAPELTAEGRQIWCGPHEGVQLVAVSTVRAINQRRSELLLSMLELPERDARCVAVDLAAADAAVPPETPSQAHAN